MHNCYDNLRLDHYNTKIFCILKLYIKKCTFIQNKLKDERISSCCPDPGIGILGGIRPQATEITQYLLSALAFVLYAVSSTIVLPPIPQRLLTADPQSIMY